MSTIGVVGLGVMGASFCARLKEKGHTIVGLDKDPTTLEQALANGWVDRALPAPGPGLLRCDIVIFCLYPSLLAGWLEENQAFLSPGTLLLEISGVKQSLMKQIKAALRPDLLWLSIHPMCGRESRGIAHADPHIFDGANFLLIPDETTPPEVLEATTELARELGCGRISTLSAREHDEMIAFLSQLTHVIALSLMNTHENEHLVAYTGDSFRDLTRIASINEDMWCELFLWNKELLLEEIAQFRQSLDAFTKALKEEDSSTMKEMMRQSTSRRQAFNKS